MGKSREEKQVDKEHALQIYAALAKVRFYPGSREQYEQRVGYAVRELELPGRNMAVTFTQTENEYNYGWEPILNFETKERLVSEGIEAVVNCTSSPETGHSPARFRGIPVARK
jgi:hypothetical protein